MHITSQVRSGKFFILTASDQYQPDIRFSLLFQISNWIKHKINNFSLLLSNLEVIL
jgi:hypothetical protein